MLVLSRRLDEAIWVGNEVRIQVLKVERHGVRLGIEAPRGVSIVREELLIPHGDEAPRAASARTRKAARC